MRKLLLNRVIGMLSVGLLLALGGAVFSQTPIPAKYNGLVSSQEPGKPKHDVVNVPFEIGHVFAAVGNGQVKHYDAAGNLLDILNSNLGGFTTGMATDSAGNLYVTNFSLALVSRFTGPGIPHNHSVYFNTDAGSSVESILFDRQRNIYVGQADGTRDILKFDAAGNLLQRYDVATEDRGSDWIELAADQQTMFYTSEGNTVKRYDVVNNVQLPDFTASLPGSIAYALRLLPGGGMLVADTEVIVRLDNLGNVIQTYDVPGEDTWFALNLDPDGISFWSGNFGTSNFYKFDIASGNVLIGPINTATGPFTLFGLAVFGEIAVGQNNRPTCQVQPAGPFFINENEPLTFTVSGSDPDPGDMITLAVNNLPSGATMTPALPLTGPNTGVSSVFNWTPAIGQGGIYEFTYTVTDTSNASDTCTVQIIVNNTPVVQANPPGPFVVQVNQPLTFDVLASDADITDVITLSVSGLPAGATMNPPLPLTGLGSGISSVFDWTPAANQAGNYLVTYSVTDGSAASQTTVSITVEANNPPVFVITPPGPFIINETDSLSFEVSVFDPDGKRDDEVRAAGLITLELLGVLPPGSAMNPSLPLTGPGSGISSTFGWTPTLGQAGLYTVTYRVSDEGGLADTAIVEITVNPLPMSPVCQITPPGPFTVLVGELLSFDVSASDPNPLDIITLSVSGLPSGAVMNPDLPLTGPASGISSNFSWTPVPGQEGSYQVLYAVVDNGGLQDTCSAQITVLPAPVNQPPVCQVAPPGPFSIFTGEPLTFTVSAFDPDVTDVITLSVNGLPSGAVMNPDLPLTGPASGISSDFSWTPAPGQEGSYQVLYTVVDNGGLHDTCSVQITVFPAAVNQPPVCQVAPPGPFSIFAGELLTFTVSASDPDVTDVITLSVNGLPSGAIMTPPLPLTGAGSGISSQFNWTPTPLQAGNYQLIYTVVDTGGLSSICTVDIAVLVNNPPQCQITPAGPFTIDEGDPLSFTVSASDPDPADTIFLLVSVLPSGATMNPPLPLAGPASGVSSVFDWTPAPGQAGNYLITYKVTDSQGDSSSCSVQITVNAPVVDTIPPSCTILGINPGPPSTLTVQLQDGESGLAQIQVLTAVNATVNVPFFTVGTNDPVLVVATRIDQTLPATVILKGIDVAGNSVVCDPVYQQLSALIPEGFSLKQNFPNPFNPTTAIHFDIPAGNGGAVNVSIKVYDITGQEVKNLLERTMQPGQYSVEWDATNNSGAVVAGGIYLYRMVAGDYVATRKMILLK